MNGFFVICFLGLFCGLSALSARLSWADLDRFQGKMSSAVFIDRMDQLYAPHADWRSWVDLFEDRVEIRMDDRSPFARYVYHFSSESVVTEAEPVLKKIPEEWTIVIDPGHLGGQWGPMEGRSFSIGTDTRGPVQEGDLTLAVARKLKVGLEALGFSVFLTRDSSDPVTTVRPQDLLSSLAEGSDETAALKTAERLFYRAAEIQARAKRINEVHRPDLVLCLHFNAAPWGVNGMAEPVGESHGHILVNGAYLEDELSKEEMRLGLFWRLFSGVSEVEIPLAKQIAQTMVTMTGLPPFTYTGSNAVEIDGSGYVWARNLMANRIYECPVIYLEPWVANEAETYEWIQTGDYEGTRMINGVERSSIVRTYAAFVIEGLRAYLDSEQIAPVTE